VEKQTLPTGEAEYQAHFDLGRLLKDFDMNSALDQYAQVAGASEALLQQARADLQPLVGTHPRVTEVLAKLGPSVVESQPPPTPSLELAPSSPSPSKSLFRGLEGLGDIPIEPVAPPAETTTHVVREASAYFDDSSAPASVETQALPTGEAEYQAHLDLARLLKDIDPDSALEQYAQLQGASESLLQQAIADLTVLTQAHPRAQALLTQWQGSAPAAPIKNVAPATPAKPSEPTPSKVEAPAAPIVEPAPRVVREASAYFDDSSAPASVEKQTLPTGEAEHQAHLDLARLLKDFDLNSALDQYAQMAGASEALLQQARADLQSLVGAHPRVTEVLTQLGSGAAAPVEAQTLAEAAIPEEVTLPEAPTETETLAAAELPVWLSAAQPATPTQPAAPQAPQPALPAPVVESGVVLPAWLASLQAQAAKPTAKAPEAKAEPSSAVQAPETKAEPLSATKQPETKVTPPPIAPEHRAPPPKPVHVPREASVYFDDSSAPASIEKQELPTGDAEQQARLDLARVMKDVDLDSALDLYMLLADANDAVKQQAYDDLAPLAAAHPRVVDIMATLQVTPTVEALPAISTPTESVVETPEVAAAELPDWLKQAQPMEHRAEAESMPAVATTEAPTEPILEPAELPDWLKQAQPMEHRAEAESMPAVATTEAPTEPILEPAELPDWLKQAQPMEHRAEATPTIEAVPAPPTVPMPTWLAALQTQPSAEAKPSEAETKPTTAETKPPVAETPTKPTEPVRAPREATAYFDDSSAPASVEKQAAPTGDAGYQAKLELARALKEFDLRAALELYDELVDASDEVKRQAIEDLKPYAAIEMRAATAVSHLRTQLAATEAAEAKLEPIPSAEAAMVEPTTELPDWLKQMQPTAEALPALESPIAPNETTAEPIVEVSELPDWLKQMQPTAEVPSTPVAEKTESKPAVVTPPTPAKPSEPAPQPAESTAGLPAWLAALQTSVQSSKPVTQTPTPTIEPTPPTPPRTTLPPPTPTVEPPPTRVPREASAYFDDSSAPPSVEKQAMPTGEAEQQARLDLARVMKDIDLDSALDLYGLLVDANDAIKQQSYDDLAPFATTHPRVPELLATLQVSAATPVEAEATPPVETIETAEIPVWLAQAQAMQLIPAAIAPSEAEAKTEEAIEAAELPDWLKAIQPTPEAPAPVEVAVRAEAETLPIHAPREASVYLDDSSAPASVEKQPVPAGAAIHQARLDLARMLRDVDVNEAVDQYRPLVEGGMMLPQVISDLLPIVPAQPKVPPLRALLVEALIRAGRALEAIPYLR
jgi:hypothetical protein